MVEIIIIDNDDEKSNTNIKIQGAQKVSHYQMINIKSY